MNWAGLFLSLTTHESFEAACAALTAEKCTDQDLLQIDGVDIHQKGANAVKLVCRACHSIVGAHNATRCRAHLALCEKFDLRKRVVVAKTLQGAGSLTKAQKKAIADFLDSQVTPPAERSTGPASDDAPPAKRAKMQQTTIDGFADRRLPPERIRQIDLAIARMVYKRGNAALEIAYCEDMQHVLYLANATIPKDSKLSKTRVHGPFLNQVFEEVKKDVADAMAKSRFGALVTDGWSGRQKRHQLNVLYCSAATGSFALQVIDTKDASVTAEYQADLLLKAMENHQITSKIAGICTDNASVMKKTWRLIREKRPEMVTYGCACHGYQLLARDLVSNDKLKTIVAGVTTIANYFSTHLRQRAALTEWQKKLGGKPVAIPKPSATRWGTYLRCTRTVRDQLGVLRAMVSSSEWPRRDHAASELEKLVVDVSFSRGLDTVCDVLEPLDTVLTYLQSDGTNLADVYASFIYMDFMYRRLADGALKEMALQHLKERVEFMIHPAHQLCFALDRRYALYFTLPRIRALKLLQCLCVEAEDEAPLGREYLQFRKSIEDPSDEHHGIWTEAIFTGLSPLEWWGMLQDNLPTLASLAFRLLSLPSSAAAAERHWSSMDHVISNKRTRLNPAKAEKLSYIHWNCKMLKPQPAAPKTTFTALLEASSNHTGFVHPVIPMLGSDHEDDDEDADEEEHEDMLTFAFNGSDDEDDEEAIPLCTHRELDVDIKRFEDVKLCVGSKVICYYDGLGWYQGIIREEFEPGRGFDVEFVDGSDYLFLSKRQYGKDRTWSVAAEREA